MLLKFIETCSFDKYMAPYVQDTECIDKFLYNSPIQNFTEICSAVLELLLSNRDAIRRNFCNLLLWTSLNDLLWIESVIFPAIV